MFQTLQENKIDNALEVLNHIPEFAEKFNPEEFNRRLISDSIILVAYSENQPVACKIGYRRWEDGSFYSWLGGVLPEFRNKGIAEKLNAEMEKLAKEKGYTSIVFKTRNKFKSMLCFGLKNGYNIVGFEEKEDVSENRIVLKKKL